MTHRETHEDGAASSWRRQGYLLPSTGGAGPACTLILDFQLLDLETGHPLSKLPHLWYFCV